MSSYDYLNLLRSIQLLKTSGACKPLAAPTNGQINCGDSTIFYRCTAHCISGYQFDNGDTTIQKDCDPLTGMFFDGPTFPKCIRNDSNPFGLGPSGACKPLPAPTNGQINCGDSTIFYRCTAHCISGYQFDNGDTTIQKDCDPLTGMFFDGPTFPKCIRNDSNPFGLGPSDACKPLPAPTDGQINCGDSTIFYRCTAQCNSGYQFDNGDTTIQKDCDPMTGMFFTGPTFPKCIPTNPPVTKSASPVSSTS
ncbi:uncharacterized protein LOC134241561 [Saccostrea cucullata]|uniref:uncharacterized protein LOC134241561 n=1 Tax=Saccostrea cuccullata TaxID=36930 RepID=UPI002ED4222C